MRTLIESILRREPRNKLKIRVSYFGRLCDFLAMTSESLCLPGEETTVSQVLVQLRCRGVKWECELGDANVICTVNGREAQLATPLRGGAVIGLHSRKTIFEI